MGTLPYTEIVLVSDPLSTIGNMVQMNQGVTMNHTKKQVLTALALLVSGVLGGCVSIESGTISDSKNVSTGTKVHTSTSHEGFLEIFGTHEDTAKANHALISQCTEGKLTDVVDQVSKRDVLFLVQIYTIRTTGVCLPPPLVSKMPVQAPKHELVHAKKTKRGIVFIFGEVLFATNKAYLNHNAQKSVDELAAYLQDHPNRVIRVEGYTDSTGSKKFNKVLSVRRAESVKSALVNSGIGADRIQIKGYGLLYPVATNSTVDGRQQNRRVEVVISDNKGHFLQSR